MCFGPMDGRRDLPQQRAQVHRDGDWTELSMTGSYGVDSGRARIWSSSGAARQDTKPLRLDVQPLGEHLRAGETVEQTLREVQEEIGQSVSLPQLCHWAFASG